MILKHDNARPQVAKPYKNYLEALKREVLPHQQYSSYIMPYLFRSMAHGLADQCILTSEDYKMTCGVASKIKDFYRHGIRAIKMEKNYS